MVGLNGRDIARYQEMCVACHRKYDAGRDAVGVDFTFPRPIREVTSPFMVRLEEKHRVIIKESALRLGIKGSEVFRRALEAFTF